MAGKPRGPKSDKLWSDAVRMAVLREDISEGQKIKRLNIIADNLVRLAMEGDMQAIKEIGDRIDGKAKQMVEGPNDDGSFTLKVSFE